MGNTKEGFVKSSENAILLFSSMAKYYSSSNLKTLSLTLFGHIKVTFELEMFKSSTYMFGLYGVRSFLV